MDNQKGWTVVIGFLVITALTAAGLVLLIYNAMQRTVEPVESMTGDLGTRVSQILNPSPTILPDPITIIRDVRSLAQLTTIQYTVEKVITAESGLGVFDNLFGDKMLFVAHGFVTAGVDLSKLEPPDLEIKNGVLYVRLPEVEVFVATLDNEKSYVYNRETGLLTKGDIQLESAVRRAAEDEIEKTALEDGILDLARQNAENYLYHLFQQLGYAEVIFIPSPAKTTSTPAP